MAIWTLPSRLTRSLLTRFSSALRLFSSSLTVASSSLLDWISSLEVSSSSLVLCSSSLADWTSSLADCSSSLAASCCSITDCRYSRVAASSCVRRALSGSGEPGCVSTWSAPSLASPPRARRRPTRLGRVFEQDQEAAFLAPASLDRNHFDGDLAVAAVGLDAQALLPHRSLLLAGPEDGRADGDEQSFAEHLQQVQAGLARGRRQVRAGVAAVLQDVQVGGDEHAGRGELGREDAVRLPVQVRAVPPAAP